MYRGNDNADTLVGKQRLATSRVLEDLRTSGKPTRQQDLVTTTLTAMYDSQAPLQAQRSVPTHPPAAHLEHEALLQDISKTSLSPEHWCQDVEALESAVNGNMTHETRNKQWYLNI